MPTSMLVHPGMIVPAPYSGAPTIRPTDDIRPSTMAGRSRARRTPREWLALPAPSPHRFRERRIGSDDANISGARHTPTSDPSLTQRIAQETEAEHPSPARRSTALAAYLRARDSHIELLSASTGLDLKV